MLINAAHLPTVTQNDVIVTNVRHYEALSKALDAIHRVQNGLDSHLSGDFLSQDIRECIFFISDIAGEVTNDMVLQNIFQHFCIGKWYSAINCNELELTTMKPLISSGFFVFQKSNYKQSDIVVHHIFLPYFYRETFSGFAPMSRWRSSLRVLTMVYVSRQKGNKNAAFIIGRKGWNYPNNESSCLTKIHV